MGGCFQKIKKMKFKKFGFLNCWLFAFLVPSFHFASSLNNDILIILLGISISNEVLLNKSTGVFIFNPYFRQNLHLLTNTWAQHFSVQSREKRNICSDSVKLVSYFLF